MNILTKILIGIIVALSIASVVQYISNNNKAHEIVSLKETITKLEENNGVLQAGIDSCRKDAKASLEAIEQQQLQIDGLRDQEMEYLHQLDYLKLDNRKVEDEKNKILDDSIGLSDDLIRMLNEHCTKISGQACPNP